MEFRIPVRTFDQQLGPGLNHRPSTSPSRDHPHHGLPAGRDGIGEPGGGASTFSGRCSGGLGNGDLGEKKTVAEAILDHISLGGIQ